MIVGFVLTSSLVWGSNSDINETKDSCVKYNVKYELSSVYKWEEESFLYLSSQGSQRMKLLYLGNDTSRYL